MRIKLKLEMSTELLFLLSACEHYKKWMYESEENWDSWGLSVMESCIGQMKHTMKKHGIK